MGAPRPYKFTGTELFKWFVRMEDYFLYTNRSSEFSKICCAMMNVHEEAYDWMQEWSGGISKIDWETFKEGMVYQFGSDLEVCEWFGFEVEKGMDIIEEEQMLDKKSVLKELTDSNKLIQDDELSWKQHETNTVPGIHHVLTAESTIPLKVSNLVGDEDTVIPAVNEVMDEMVNYGAEHNDGVCDANKKEGHFLGDELIQQLQVPFSQLEPSLRLLREEEVGGDNDVLTKKAICGKDNSLAHPVFDILLLRVGNFKHLKPSLSPKSWKFKFKKSESKEMELCVDNKKVDSYEEWAVYEAYDVLSKLNENESESAENMNGKVVDKYEMDPTGCVMSVKKHTTLESCMDHIHMHHDFFMFGVEYLKDPEGLLTFFSLKVKRDFLCLYFNELCRLFNSLEVVKKHKENKSHCKLHYSDEGDNNQSLKKKASSSKEFQFLSNVLEENEKLKEYYKKNTENNEFWCLVYDGTGGKSYKKFKRCLAVIQHLLAIHKIALNTLAQVVCTVHKAFAWFVCELLGWNFELLPGRVLAISKSGVTLNGGPGVSAKMKLSNGTEVHIDELEDCIHPTHEMSLLLPKSWKFKFKNRVSKEKVYNWRTGKGFTCELQIILKLVIYFGSLTRPPEIIRRYFSIKHHMNLEDKVLLRREI